MWATGTSRASSISSPPGAFVCTVNPPQVTILTTGSASEQVCPNTNGIKSVMKATLTFDRRFTNVALAVDFCVSGQG